jgi:hypothetical protein
MKKINKRYIVRKYIMAKTAQEALKKERRYRPDDVWVDEEWKREQSNNLESAIGFTTDSERDYED